MSENENTYCGYCGFPSPNHYSGCKAGECESLRSELEEAKERIKGMIDFWECPVCLFRMDVVHRDSATQEYSCPNCCEEVLIRQKKEAECALTAANERAEKAERELEECRQRKGKIAAYRIVTEAENAHLRNLLREKLERDMGALIAAFCMVYTSPAWGGDERSPEGWEQKDPR